MLPPPALPRKVYRQPASQIDHFDTRMNGPRRYDVQELKQMGVLTQARPMDRSASTYLPTIKHISKTSNSKYSKQDRYGKATE